MRSENYVTWSETLALGFPEIDDQHKKLIGMINEVWKGLMSYAGKADAGGVVAELVEYVDTHLRDEEALMEQYGYPALEEHKRSHAFFSQKVAEMEAQVEAGNTVGLELLQFLMDWFAFHIRMVDRQYADYIHSKGGHPV